MNATPEKGVYLGILKVLSSTDGFKIMVNEHNRIMIPLIFISCSQLSGDELTWMSGVRVRESRGIDLLEGKKPNRGWLGPEMSGEEGATFPEKLWWAIDEAKARLNCENIGFLYDFDLMQVDENSNLQLVMFSSLAKDENDILPGHVWADRQFLEVQNMKYMCPVTLQGIVREQTELMAKFQQINQQEGGDMEAESQRRKQKEAIKNEIESKIKALTPLKCAHTRRPAPPARPPADGARTSPLAPARRWVNRTIMWVAEKMPSFADKIEGGADMDIPALVEAANKANQETRDVAEQRTKLLATYLKK